MNEIIQGDCLEVMKTFPDNHFSAIVTDPPYGLHFMGKEWDKFNKSNFSEYERGNYKQLEGHKRTHRSIRSANAASGVYDPKRDDEFQSFMHSWATEVLRIVKPGGHILMFGAPRRYHRQVCALEDAGFEIRDCLMWIFGSGFPKSHNGFGIPGFGTALKPAYEPIIMAMKPCDGTFAQNAEKWGQAGINIDGCRIHVDSLDPNHRPNSSEGSKNSIFGIGGHVGDSLSNKGRWPANLILDEEAGKILDEQSEMTASRFFYCAKTSSRERNEGLDGMPDKICQRYAEQGQGHSDQQTPRKPVIEKNNHPTVKPLKLMEYLIKLVMPPKDGILLDPFAGSGSTIVAAERLGFNSIGIEKQSEYAEIARARLKSTKSPFAEKEQMEIFA